MKESEFYLSFMKIIAYPVKDGFYKLVDVEIGSCYAIRWTIRAIGGQWDGVNWIIDESILTKLGIKKVE